LTRCAKSRGAHRRSLQNCKEKNLLQLVRHDFKCRFHFRCVEIVRIIHVTRHEEFVDVGTALRSAPLGGAKNNPLGLQRSGRVRPLHEASIRHMMDKQLTAFIDDHARRFGIHATGSYVARKAIDRIVGYTPWICLVRATDEPFPRPGVSQAELAYRVVRSDEITRAARDPLYEISPAFLDTALTRGDLCMGAFAGERLVAFGFSSAQPTNIDADFCFSFPPGWMYNFKEFTLPAWRGRRIHAALWGARRWQILRERGVRNVVALVMATNYPSLASFRRLGFRRAFGFAIVGKGEKRCLLARGSGRQATFRLPDEQGEFSVSNTRFEPGLQPAL
jgi:hypothetical protein